MINGKSGRTVPTFKFVLGDNSGIIEVSKIGQQCFNLMQQVHKWQDQTVVLSKAQWNQQRQQLQHDDFSSLQVHSQYQLDDVKFPMFDDFSELPKLPEWSRVSLNAFIMDAGESVPNQKDGKVGKGWIRSIIVANMRSQGMIVKVVHQHEEDLDFLEQGAPITIIYAKTFPGGVYADLTDLTQLGNVDADMAGMCPDFSAVMPISWA